MGKFIPNLNYTKTAQAQSDHLIPSWNRQAAHFDFFLQQIKLVYICLTYDYFLIPAL